MRACDDGGGFSAQFQLRPGIDNYCYGLLLLLVVTSDGYLVVILYCRFGFGWVWILDFNLVLQWWIWGFGLVS